MRRILLYALTLASGVALGVVFTLGVVFWFSEGVRDESPVPVLVAKQSIPSGTKGKHLLSREMYVRKTVPRWQLEDGAIAEPDYVCGRVADTNLFPGEQLTASSFRPEEGQTIDPGFSTTRWISTPKGPKFVFFCAHALSTPWQIPECPPETVWSPGSPCQPDERLAWNGTVELTPVIAARVVGPEVRYVLQSKQPARFLKRGWMSFNLSTFRFGEKGRPTLVRLVDGDGRFAWAARYDGVQKMTVRARPDLVRCFSPFRNGDNRTLPDAPGAADGPRCPLEPYEGIPIGGPTVLR